jgi:DNA-binding NtrC family response regulator
MLPPLRDRKDDIPAISEAILVNINKKHGCRITGLHPSTLERFQNYAWPGNIRELRNALERAAIMAGEGLILPKHLAMDPGSVPTEQPVAQAPSSQGSSPQSAIESEETVDSIRVRPGATMEEIEEMYINLVLQRTNNNKTKAADILGISVRTLHNRLGQLINRKANSAVG